MEFYLFSSLHLPLFLPFDIVVKNVKRRCYLLLVHNFASFIFNPSSAVNSCIRHNSTFYCLWGSVESCIIFQHLTHSIGKIVISTSILEILDIIQLYLIPFSSTETTIKRSTSIAGWLLSC